MRDVVLIYREKKTPYTGRKAGGRRFYNFYMKTINNSSLLKILFGHGERASKDVMLSIRIITANFGSTDNSYIQVLYNYGLVMLLKIY